MRKIWVMLVLVGMLFGSSAISKTDTGTDYQKGTSALMLNFLAGSPPSEIFDEDQLYNLKNDSKEMRNLANNERQADRLKEMRSLMEHDLQAIGRPFGEFIPGHNTSAPGQIDKQIEIVKKTKSFHDVLNSVIVPGFPV